MKGLRSGLILLVLSVLVIPASAGQSTGGETTVDAGRIRTLRREVERNRALSEETRTRILGLCDTALAELNRAKDFLESADSFERERRDVDRQVRELRAELERPAQRSRPDLPEHATVEEAEDALARERARLAANRAALRDQERLAEESSQTRGDISHRLGELDLELELLDDRLRALENSDASTDVREASRLAALARKKAVLAEREKLRSRLRLLADRSIVNPLEIDLAQRRVGASEELVDELSARVHELRAEKARASLGRIREQCRTLVEQAPEAAHLARETLELAQELWGPDGVIVRSERTAKELSATRAYRSTLSRIAELTRRKFEAYGGRGAITRWWPKIPKGFPRSERVAETIQQISEQAPEVEYRLISYEQLRSGALDVTRTTVGGLADGPPDLVRTVREILSTRQDLLDQLILREGRYSAQLEEYRAASEDFLEELRKLENFLLAHALWSRSVPRPLVPRPRAVFDAVRWWLPGGHMEDLSFDRFSPRKTLFPGLLAFLVLLLGSRAARRRLHSIAERISGDQRGAFGLSVEAALWTAVLAFPLPIALWTGSAFLREIGSGLYWTAAASALSKLALIALLFESIRNLFRPSGLAEAHFGWPGRATRPLYRGLLMTESIGLPLLFVGVHLAYAGLRLGGPEELQLHNNSLGRLAFISAMLLFGISILAMLRPVKNAEAGKGDVRVSWPRRFSEYAFPTAFLGAYPIIFLATVVPAVLAAIGYYLTGMLLAWEMLRTLFLALILLVAGGLMHRRQVAERAVAQDSDDEDLEENLRQERRLFKFAVIITLAVGLFSIWSDALPLLQALKRVQVLPTVRILEPPKEGPIVSRDVETVTKSEPEGEGTASSVIPGVPGSAGIPATGGSEQDGGAEAAPGIAAEDQSLTLWEILEAILAAIVTIALVGNLPGVIEIILKRRTKLDGGARFAFSTLARYLISIVGAIVVFGLLGVTWSMVQWLAAALTFGLGFGLQEIVANFVSGLILLVERPVRVGDVVTIGTLMGRVSRIQIRATTITLWDRSEMIVPNKEFITTKLVNWTLSDSKRRIEIPVRVRFGADLEEVRTTMVSIAEEHPAVLDDPAPHVLLLRFADDAVNFELRFVVDFGKGLKTKDEVQMAIEAAFRERGIEFALPRTEVRLVSGEETPVPVSPEET